MELLNHPMLYWNKEKARRWTGDEGLQLPVAPYPERAYEISAHILAATRVPNTGPQGCVAKVVLLRM